MPTNPFTDLIRGSESGEEEDKYASILVSDKFTPENVQSIYEVSLPLKLLAEQKIVIVRVYVDRPRVHEARSFCAQELDKAFEALEGLEKKGW